MPKGKLILIDGHALAYRAYYALPLDLSTSKGELTNAVFGFTSMLLNVLSEEEPGYMAVAFDVGKSFRHEEYRAYKADRAKMPDDLAKQLERIHQVVRALGIPILEVGGYEADDVLGALASQVKEEGMEVLIVTGDTDAFQLIDESTKVLTSRRKFSDTVVYDEAAIRARYGLKPKQLIDFKALTGDRSDNIPGVKGVGKKTATKLLQRYGTLEEIYAHLDEVESTRFRNALEKGAHLALLSKRLATIVTDAPVELDLEDCRLGEFDREKVMELFRELEFRSLVDRLPPAKGQKPPQQLSMFEGEERQALGNYNAVTDEGTLDELVAKLSHAKGLAFDVETTGTDPMAVDLVGISLTAEEGEGYYIPMGHEAGGKQLPLDHVLAKLNPILGDESIPKYAHNGKYDLTVLARYGLRVEGLASDTMIAEWLINPASKNLGLKNLAWARLGVEMEPIIDLIGTGRGRITMAQVPIEEAAPYACADVDMTYRLVKVLEPELREKELWPLFMQVEMPLVSVLSEMEMKGVKLDVEFLQHMAKGLQGRLTSLERQIQDMVGYPFNVNSTQQLSDALFVDLGLPAQGVPKTKTSYYSTAAGVLEKLRGEHPVIDLILEYRELSKLKSTYVDALPGLVNERTGRIHTSYNQTGTVTGRVSCLPAGTLVNTQRGLVGIEAVRPGDLIRTPYGPRRILNWQATGEKSVVVLKLSNGITLRCSPQHRLRSKEVWIKAEDITVGTPVYMSFTEGLFGERTELNLDYTSEYRTCKTPSLPTKWTVDLAELVGEYMADGHIARSNYNDKPAKVVLAFGWDEDELMDHFSGIVQRIFGKAPTRRDTKSCPVLEVSGVDIGGTLEQLGAGGHSSEIRVPPGIFAAPEPVVAAFLRGYFEGDGCVSDQISVRSVSRAMLEDIQQLLTLFGIPSSISEGSPDRRGYARRYTLRIVGDRPKRVFHDRIGFLSTKKRKACAELAANWSKKSTAELLTLPDGFDIGALKPHLYAAHRGSDGRVPRAIIVFAHKFAAGRQTITLPRAEWIVNSLPNGEATQEADFLHEVVDGQYYEVTVNEISYEAPVPMYDIAVEEVEQYIAQGIIVHNSSEPNLQNIPIRTELGRQVRRAFVAAPGHLFLSADYSQVELRILAHISRDEGLLSAFRRGEDIHASTATALYDVSLEAVGPGMRRLAKTVNFGVTYGMSGYGLAQRTGLSREEASHFIKSYFAKHPRVKKYVEETKRKAREQGYVETLLGRRRYFPELTSTQAHWRVKRAAEREAINMPIQGTAADILKIAMIELDRAIRERGLKGRMILQVHDELVLEVPEDELKTVKPLVESTMEKAFELDAPLKVDLKVGRNWLEMGPVKA